ncbi:F-box only protein 9-like [Ornithodoros turicata]|uniref:F-box only protein 9-like n=1 Tax=Ornithodoros turicata TaxID=34597 RepID=UPI0031396E6A
MCPSFQFRPRLCRLNCDNAIIRNMENTTCAAQPGSDDTTGADDGGDDEEPSSRRAQGDLHLLERAKQMYIKGAVAEKSGHVYEAISFYRRAVQLVPDIEFRLADSCFWSFTDDESEDSDIGNKSEDETGVDDSSLPLYQRIKLQHSSASTCQVASEQKATHISDLPREVFSYILRWVVSSDLDLLSLEAVSKVCRGFYLCARDPELWHLVCQRTWGLDCGQLLQYKSWREMYILRPRLRYNGVYINKTTYVRQGESSFQDSSYRPCFLVEYFRYLRFFPEGKVLMLTTADNPYLALGKLRSRRQVHSSVLVGRFHLDGNHLQAVLQRVKSHTGVKAPYRRLRQHPVEPEAEQTFHVELELRTVRGRSNVQLVWRNYAIHTFWKGEETVTTFELTQTTFPALWFSRVKSFTSVAETAL